MSQEFRDNITKTNRELAAKTPRKLTIQEMGDSEFADYLRQHMERNPGNDALWDRELLATETRRKRARRALEAARTTLVEDITVVSDELASIGRRAESGELRDPELKSAREVANSRLVTLKGHLDRVDRRRAYIQERAAPAVKPKRVEDYIELIKGLAAAVMLHQRDTILCGSAPTAQDLELWKLPEKLSLPGEQDSLADMIRTGRLKL